MCVNLILRKIRVYMNFPGEFYSKGGIVMKSTGIVREIDELGRITLPIEMRRTFGIEKKDPIEIYVEEDKIILKKYSPSCLFCGESDGVIFYGGKYICKDCLEKIKKEF